MTLCPRVLLVAALSAVFAGCSTASRTVGQVKSPPVYAWQHLLPGMNSEQVERIMGKPRKMRPNPAKKGTIWTYERLIGTRVDPVSGRIVYEMWIDPIDNQIKPIPVPMQGLQRTDVLEVVEVEIVDDTLMSLQRNIENRRGFTD